MGARSLSRVAAPVEERPVAVAVVAADDVMRHRAASALTRDGQLVAAQATSWEQADAELEPSSVDAVVIACANGADARERAIRAAKKRFPTAHVVIVANADLNGVHRDFRVGADGVVFDSELEATLSLTVRAVCVGQVVLPPVLRSSVVRPALTHREKQALSLLVLGLTNGEIAHRLFLAESTVKCHLTSIFSKLGVRSRSEAAARVLDPQSELGLDIFRLADELGTGSRR